VLGGGGGGGGGGGMILLVLDQYAIFYGHQILQESNTSPLS